MDFRLTARFGVLLAILAVGSALTAVESFRSGPLAPPLPDVQGGNGTALEVLAGSRRYDAYRVVEDTLDGGAVLIGPGVRQPGWLQGSLDPVLLIGIAGVREVERIDAVAHLSDSAATTSGTYWGGRWRLQRLDGPLAALVANVDDEGDLLLTDSRLLPNVAVAPATSGFERAPSDGLATVGPRLTEWLLLLLMLLVGGLLLPRQIVRAIRIPLALLVGVAGLAVTAPLRSPGLLGLLLLIVLGVLGWFGLRFLALDTGWCREDLPALLAAAAAAGLGVVMVRANGWVVSNPDSVDYLAGARTLADGLMDVQFVQAKRGLAQQTMHAASFAVGGDWMHALGPAVLVATAALLGAQLWRAAGSRGGRTAAVLAAGVLLLSPSVRTLAMYVNSHMLVGGLLLGLVVLMLHAAERDEVDRALAPAAAVVAGAVALLRPEGVALVGLVAIGGSASRRWARATGATWVGAGAAAVTWSVLLLVGGVERGEPVSGVLVLQLVAGLAMALVPLVLRRFAHRTRQVLAVGALASLWVLALAVSLASDRVRFWSTTRENLLAGAGGWGILAPLILLLIALGLAAAIRGGSAPPAGWALIAGVVPLMLVAKLLDGPGDEVLAAGRDLLSELSRGGGAVGWRDSINRSWLHVVPVALLTTVRASIDAPITHRSSPRSARWLAAGLAAVVGLVVIMWSPGYLAPSDRAVAVAGSPVGLSPVGELTQGVRVVQRLEQDSSAADAVSELAMAQVCASMTVGTYGRPLASVLEVAISGSAGTQRDLVDGVGLLDNVEVEVCLPADGIGTEGPYEVEVTSLIGPPGASPTLWVGDPDSVPRGSTLVLGPGSSAVEVGPVVSSLIVRGTTLPTSWRILQSVLRMAPAALLLIIVGVLLSESWPSPSGRGAPRRFAIRGPRSRPDGRRSATKDGRARGGSD